MIMSLSHSIKRIPILAFLIGKQFSIYQKKNLVTQFLLLYDIENLQIKNIIHKRA